MSERLTSVEVPGSGHPGFADWGHHDPQKMIQRLRDQARAELKAAQKILEAPDSAFLVETYRGVHARQNVKKLWPSQEGVS